MSVVLYICNEELFFSLYFHIFRYVKLRDDDNWLIIDEKTADIRLNKLPDRESKFLVNGTYYANIICITNGEFSKCNGYQYSPVDTLYYVQHINAVSSFDL